MRVGALRKILSLAAAAAFESACQGAPGPGTPTTPTTPRPSAPVAEPPPARVYEVMPERTPHTGAPGPYTMPFTQSDRWELLRRELRADYVGDWHFFAGNPGTPGQGAGTACRSATDVAACQRRLVASSAPRGLWPGHGPRIDWDVLVVTRGDDVRVISDPEALRAFLVHVDTEVEVDLVAGVAGYDVELGRPWIREVEGGYEVLATTIISDCPVTEADVRLLVRRDGSIVELEHHDRPPGGTCFGRRPAGLCAERPRRRAGQASPLGRYFARAARLEAASVHAFDVLRAELTAHGAPARLVRAAELAMRDERAHAATVGALARRFGGVIAAARVARAPVRSLRAIALENAREGCVRETWGALEARWQATRAADPRVRRCMRTIARDELRHAALAWQVAAWCEPRLDAKARRAVRVARLDAAAELRAELAHEPHPELRAAAGLPGAVAAGRVFARLHRELFAA